MARVIDHTVLWIHGICCVVTALPHAPTHLHVDPVLLHQRLPKAWLRVKALQLGGNLLVWRRMAECECILVQTRSVFQVRMCA